MFNIGSQELLFILLLVFLLFGPRHIPEVARVLGKGLGDIQRAMRGMEDSVRRAASEIPTMVADEPEGPTPKILPAPGAVERAPIPTVAEVAPPPQGSSPTPTSDGLGDAEDRRPEPGA